MNENKTVLQEGQVLKLSRRLKVLTGLQIEQIDGMLAELGPFAQVRLIKEKGKLRFIQKLESENAIWSPSTE